MESSLLPDLDLLGGCLEEGRVEVRRSREQSTLQKLKDIGN